MASSQRNQAAEAQKMYDERSASYDDSWHPRFARHLVELADLRPGESVLDLACGTGLVSVAACEAVQALGLVVGIDISPGMLAQARTKRELQKLENLELYEYSISDLRLLGPIRERKFDVVTCASALVLLDDPLKAVTEWLEYLKPGGRLVVDVTHPQSQVPGITMERVGRDLGLSVPYHRLAFEDVDDLRKLLKEAGLQQVVIHSLSQTTVAGTEALNDYRTDALSPRVEREYTPDDLDVVFERTISHPIYKNFSQESCRARAKEAFLKHMRSLQDSKGNVQDFDCVLVGVAVKPQS